MDLIFLVLVVALIGGLVYLITTYIPMPPMWAATIQIVALIIVILYVISRFFTLPNVMTR